MFSIRQATIDDLPDLYALARQTYFINLPPDKDIIAVKIEQSAASFRSLAAATSSSHKSERKAASRTSRHARTASQNSSRSGHRATTSLSDLFLFVVEQSDSPGVIGTSQVIAAMGGKGHPRVFFQLSRVVRRSESLKRGIEHTVGTIGVDETGPTEVGGIIVNQAFRGAGLGKFLSLVRFHLMGVAPERFANRVVAEMLGPIDDKGHNPFFEKFTRRFIPYSWEEIYRFSQTSREFVAGLMPPEPIYLTTMEPEVAGCAGEVSEHTLGARRMLESIGFRSFDRIDPLDGGPHLEAPVADIAPVAATRRVAAIELLVKPPRSLPQAIVSTLNANGEFRAVLAGVQEDGSAVSISKDAWNLLAPDAATLRGVTMLESSPRPASHTRSRRKS